MSLYLGTNLVAPNSSNSANKDLSNLTDTGKNISNWSSNVSNCITEIPQDIKLELNNGTLTLKAGSKVYVPNGFESDGTTPKFDVVTIASNISKTATGTYNDLLYVINGDTLDSRRKSTMFFSGSTAPTGFGQYAVWYDTTNNIIKRTDDSGSTWKTGNSFPIAEITSTSGSGITSIDQVFNGFGYVGGIPYALPGVKGLICNGKNDDGSYKSIPFTVENVIIAGTVYPFNNNVPNYGLLRFDDDNNLIISRSAAGTTSYDINNNVISRTDGTMPNACMAFETYSNSSVIDGFRIKNVFNAADGNSIDGQWIAKSSDIASNISGDSSYSTTFTLTDLPNDGNSYEVVLCAQGRTGTTSGNTCRIYLSSRLCFLSLVTYSVTRTSSYVASAGTVTIPVGSDRKVTMSFNNVTGTMSSVYLQLKAYRRLGFGS